MMGLFKKVISSVCAIGMLATLVASMTVAQAAGDPVMNATLTSYNNETGEGEFKVAISGVQTGEYDFFQFTGFNARVSMNADDFDTTMYKYSALPTASIKKNVLKAGPITALAYGGYGTPAADAFAVTASSQEVFDDAFDLFTVKFKVKDVTKDNTITVSFAKYIANALDSEGEYKGQLTYYKDGITDGAKPLPEDRTLAVNGGITTERTSTTIVIPGNDSATADSSTIKTIKPSDIGGEGDVWASADGSENAVAGLANFTPSAATSTIEWTISVTPVGGKAASYTQTFDLGASIDAAATIGLIVNYNTAEYSSVSIVSGALK